MKRSIKLWAVLFALVSLCLVFASCDSGSSDSDDPTPPPVPTVALPEGALAGEFSVGANKQVHFSKGNLWYGKVGSATTATFNFEDNQYSFAGSWDANHVSHFRWAAKSGILADDVASAISTETSLSGGTSDVFFTNATTESANVDFTVNGVTGKYRTLSKDEWLYLFNTRTVNGNTGAGYSYSLNITYGGKMGVVLYPDDYTGSVLSGSVTNLPEGVVFLPAAGFRDGSDVYVVGSGGGYWSATPVGSGYAFFLYFDSSNALMDDRYRYYGFSVRLVVDEN